jgi:hypothetical protein
LVRTIVPHLSILNIPGRQEIIFPEKEMPSSAPPQFRLGPGFWASTPEPAHHDLLHRYTVRAQELLARLQEFVPDDERLLIIVQAAVEARALYFVAALVEPTTADLDEYFDHFVMRSASGIHGFNEAQNEN